MKSRPIPVLIVAFLFILAGAVGLIYHSAEFLESDDKIVELIWVLILRIVAIICGVLLLLGINWSRWLAIAWLAYHVYVSSFHSISEMITHIVLLIVFSVLLYLPVSNSFFLNYHKSKP